MEEWETDVGLGVAFGTLVAVAIFAIDVSLVWLASRQTVPSFGTYLIGLAVLASLGLEALLGFWLYGLVDSGYFLDRNALVIHWGPMEQIVPIGQIERVVRGEQVGGRITTSGGVWPGHYVGHGDIPDIGPTLFYSTARPRGQVFVVTPAIAYGVSPADRDGFLQSLGKRLEMGPTQVVEQSSKRPAFLGWRVWRDWRGLTMVGIGLVSLVILTGLICFLFPSLPNSLPLHFGATGRADRFAPRVYVFVLPLIGLLVALANGAIGWILNSRERLASHMAWAGSVLVQALIWVAALGILTRV
jgi:hypothetical protein